MQEDLAPQDGKRYPPSTVFTLREAADAAGVSLSTVERRHKKGKFGNAYRDTRNGLGTWLIPVGDLVDADLLDSDAIAVDLRAIDLEQTTLRFEAQVAALKAELEARTDEVRFLRSLVVQNGRVV